jgi:DNA-binding response OmpR family regulator
MQTYARFARLTSELDADFNTAQPADVAHALADTDLVVCSTANMRRGAIAELEQMLHTADNTALLLIVEHESLKTLRLPARIPADFILPTSPDAEVVIRMRHLLWPGEETANTDFITIDSMAINLSTYQVLVDGVPVDFTYLEYALLAFLVTHPGHAYSRDALLSCVWGFDYYGGSRTVDVHVRRVRSKLGNELSAHLCTIRGVGYMWE